MERDGNDSVIFESAGQRYRWRSRSPTLDPLSTFWRSPPASALHSPRNAKFISFDYFETEPYILEKRDVLDQGSETLTHFPIVFEPQVSFKLTEVGSPPPRLEPIRKKDSTVSDVEGLGGKAAALRGLKKQVSRIQQFWKRTSTHQPNVFQKVQVLSRKSTKAPEDEEDCCHFEDSIHRFTGDNVSSGDTVKSDDQPVIVMTEDFSNKLICNSERIDELSV